MDEKFPVYLEIVGGKSIYCISSASELEEIQVIGERYTVHQMEARILPERLLIQDMLTNEGGRWLRISEEEFEAKKTLITQKKNLL